MAWVNARAIPFALSAPPYRRPVAYRVIVLYDDETVLDTVAELEEWPGFGEGLPGNVSVALNSADQEHPQKALLQKAIDGLPPGPEVDRLKQTMEAMLPRTGQPPVLCFSYDDPGPRRKDGTPVRSNIERVIEPGMALPVSVSGDRPTDPPHEYLIVVEEVA